MDYPLSNKFIDETEKSEIARFISKFSQDEEYSLPFRSPTILRELTVSQSTVDYDHYADKDQLSSPTYDNQIESLQNKNSQNFDYTSADEDEEGKPLHNPECDEREDEEIEKSMENGSVCTSRVNELCSTNETQENYDSKARLYTHSQKIDVAIPLNDNAEFLAEIPDVLEKSVEKKEGQECIGISSRSKNIKKIFPDQEPKIDFNHIMDISKLNKEFKNISIKKHYLGKFVTYASKVFKIYVMKKHSLMGNRLLSLWSREYSRGLSLEYSNFRLEVIDFMTRRMEGKIVEKNSKNYKIATKKRLSDTLTITRHDEQNIISLKRVIREMLIFVIRSKYYYILLGMMQGNTCSLDQNTLFMIYNKNHLLNIIREKDLKKPKKLIDVFE